MSQLTKNKLQYNNEFLDKIIISSLMDQKFLIKCIDLDVKQYIDSQPHKWILGFIIDFYSQYKVIPTMESIKIKIQGLRQPLFKQTVSTTYISVIDKFDENNLEFIKDTVLNFCRFQQLKTAILKSIDLLKQQNFQQIYDLINQTRFKGMDSSLGIQYVSSFVERHTQKLQTHKVIETPWPVLNGVMQGGSKSGRLNLIVSPPGTGKSWFLCNIASHALKQGKKVVYYTLEMQQWQIAQRIDIKLLDKPKQYIHMNAEKLAPQLQQYRDNLRVKQFLPNHTKLVQIENHITQLSLFENFDADVVIIDHGDNLKLQGNINNLYGAYGTNFVGMKTLAKRTKKIVWSASQGNRNSIGQQFLLGDGISHSMMKLEIADFVISLSRKHEDKLSNTARFVVIKNRHGKDGMIYNGLVDLQLGDIQIFDSYTKESVDARSKMDNNDKLMKQKVKQRLKAIKNKKQETV